LLVAAPASAETTDPAAETDGARATVGAFASTAGVVGDGYTTTLYGGRFGGRLTPRDWLAASFARGSMIVGDGYAQESSSVWEVEVTYSRHDCGRDLACAVPSLGVGYQHGEATFLDGLVMDLPWTETIERWFGEARIAGRVQLVDATARGIGVELGVGLRAYVNDHDATVAPVVSCAIDAVF
jgi:hypothetical protein